MRTDYENEPRLMDDPIDERRMQPFSPFNLVTLRFKGGDSDVKETESERAAAQVAAERWNYYQTEFGRPQENQFMDNVKEMDTDGAYDFAEGATNKEFQGAAADSLRSVGNNERSLGMNDNSSRSKLADATTGIEMAGKAGSAKSGALIDQKDRHLSGVEAVVNIGQGKATSAQMGMGDIASAAHDQARSDTISDFSDGQSLRSAAGTAVGMGGRAAMEAYDNG